MKELMSPKATNTKKDISGDECKSKRIKGKKKKGQPVLYDNTSNRIRDIPSTITKQEIENICFLCIKNRLILDDVLTDSIHSYMTDKNITSDLKNSPNTGITKLKKKFLLLLANNYNWELFDINELSNNKKAKILHSLIKDNSIIIKRGVGNSVRFYQRKKKSEKYLNLNATLLNSNKLNLYFEISIPDSSIYEGFNFAKQNLLCQEIDSKIFKEIIKKMQRQ